MLMNEWENQLLMLSEDTRMKRNVSGKHLYYMMHGQLFGIFQSNDSDLQVVHIMVTIASHKLSIP